MKKKNNSATSYYIGLVWTVLIYCILTLILLGLSLLVYFVFKGLFTRVFQVEQAVGDMVSLIASILFFVLPLIPKMKNLYIRLVNLMQQGIYKQLRKRFLPNDLTTTAEQATVINSALGLLKKNGSHFIALESAPSKGKTMTAVQLIDNIGRDKKLLELFIQLQHHICYIDAGYEKNYLMNYLDDNTIVAESLTIVDNVHKLSSEALIEVLNKITAISAYANSIGSKQLIILLYQGIDNNSTNFLLHEYFANSQPNDRKRFFTLSYDLNYNYFELKSNRKIDEDGMILNRIRNEHSDLIRAHLLNVYAAEKGSLLINFLLKVLNKRNSKKSFIELDQLALITIIVVLSMHLGFVTKDAIMVVWDNLFPKYRKSHCKHLIKNFSKNRFILQFPLMQSAFLFNESLAHEYKKRLFSIKQFKEYYYQCANYLYKSNLFNAVELEWLFLVSCRPCEILSISDVEREKVFFSCINLMNKSYVLAALEEELSLDPQKCSIFQMELGILYIKTGQWTQARQVLKPYICQEQVPSKIYQLQLQVIEADHGVNDDENLIILNRISNKSDDPYIRFQAQYWVAHIKMEQGDFSLKIWEKLQEKIEENPKWKDQHTYPNLVHRITADACRTFFLKGSSDYTFFNCTLDFFENHRLKPNMQEDLALVKLENAHYIHYELVYQLGIWRIYRFQHDRSRSFDDTIGINELIEKALQIYDASIAQFMKAGVKTWRTAQIRRAELSLCSTLPNYIEILSQLDEFEHYARENRVDVFNGYIACLQGKAFAIYALSEAIENEDTSYERSLDNSISAFQRSMKIYNSYGNIFGVLRSKMLYILVDTIKKIGTEKDPIKILEYFTAELKSMKKRFNQENVRELQVIEYLTSMPSLKVADIGNVIKYYPIVLQ